MTVNNKEALVNISDKIFQKMTYEAIDKILTIMQETAFKYFDDEIHPDDVFNFYLNTLSNVFLHIHLVTFKKSTKQDIEEVLKLFSTHIMKTFIMKKELGQ